MWSLGFGVRAVLTVQTFRSAQIVPHLVVHHDGLQVRFLQALASNADRRTGKGILCKYHRKLIRGSLRKDPDKRMESRMQGLAK